MYILTHTQIHTDVYRCTHMHARTHTPHAHTHRHTHTYTHMHTTHTRARARIHMHTYTNAPAYTMQTDTDKLGHARTHTLNICLWQSGVIVTSVGMGLRNSPLIQYTLIWDCLLAMVPSAASLPAEVRGHTLVVWRLGTWLSVPGWQ